MARNPGGSNATAPAGVGDSGKTVTAVSPRFNRVSDMEANNRLTNLRGRVDSRAGDAYKVESMISDMRIRGEGNTKGLQALADKRFKRIEPARRAMQRYQRMMEASGIQPR